jgi:cysteine synthase A
MGIAKALREVYPKLYVAAVEPTESPVMSGGVAAPHDIAGIGDGFVPTIVKTDRGELAPSIDEIICVKSSDAMKASTDIANNFGYCVGISSGANYLAAQNLLGRFANVVTVLPDGFTRYISRGLRPTDRCSFHGEACRAARKAAMQKSVDSG